MARTTTSGGRGLWGPGGVAGPGARRRRWLLGCLSLLGSPCLVASPTLPAPVMVLDVKVDGNAMVGAETILRAVAPVLRPGQRVADPVEAAALARERVLQLGYFDEAQVMIEEDGVGARFTITVVERIRVTRVVFEGNARLEAEQVAPTLLTRPGRFVDPQLLWRDVDTITERLRARGLAVSVEDVRWDSQGVVTFVVVAPQVSRVEFRGLVSVRPAEAEAVASLAAGTVLTPEVLASATERLGQTGWFDRARAETRPDEGGEAGNVVVVFTVRERPGLFPDRVGAPPSEVDVARLRRLVGPPTINLEFGASMVADTQTPDPELPSGAALPELEAAAIAGTATGAQLRELAQRLAAEGRHEEAMVQWRAAAEKYQRALEQDPDHPVLVFGLSAGLAALGQTKEALELLRHAVARHPENWQLRLSFVRIASQSLLASVVPRSSSAEVAAPVMGVGREDIMPAVAELIPWERTRAAAVAAFSPHKGALDLVDLAREARARLEEALRLAAGEPAVQRAAFALAWQAATALASSPPAPRELVEVFREEAREVATRMSESAAEDPSLMLWILTVRVLLPALAADPAGTAGGGASVIAGVLDELEGQLKALVARWPEQQVAASKLLGMAQLMAGRRAEARRQFQEVVAVAPEDRQAYNPLIALALENEDLEEAQRLVTKRMTANPAAEDLLMLGKIAIRREQPEQAMACFRQAMAQFPYEALGYLATAGWLVHLGEDDEEAQRLLDQGLALDPTNAYGHAVRCALLLLQSRGEEARAALIKALSLNPVDDLANRLRAAFFAAQ